MKVPDKVYEQLEAIKTKMKTIEEPPVSVQEISTDIMLSVESKYYLTGPHTDIVVEWLKSFNSYERINKLVSIALYLVDKEELEVNRYRVVKVNGYTLEQAEQIVENFGGEINSD